MDQEGIKINARKVTLSYVYPYEIDLAQIKTERDLLTWVLHLCGKTWMTQNRLRIFIEAVARVKGFSVYGC